MFERPASGQRAVLVHLQFPLAEYERAQFEFRELVRSSGAVVLAELGGQRKAPDPRHFVGGGKAREVAELIAAHGAELAIFNHDLSPSQERNLEALLKCRVLGRAGLILDIFARRARSHEGKLQVELAQLRHLSTRLVRGWSHLERQKGGIGLRGPGETQLETDRRLIGDRIKRLRDRVDKVRARRAQGRAARQRAHAPTISLVGYTNAGKSTLFNRLTGAELFAADQLFATLDPTMRKLDLPVGEAAVLADTVGFIRDLPPELVAAFNATLEETLEAQVLLHVIDAADSQRREHAEQVNTVLSQIGAGSIPQIEVFNKIDALPDGRAGTDRDPHGRTSRVWCSAASGEGLAALRYALAEACYPDLLEGELALSPREGRLRARLFDLGAVREERYGDDGDCLLRVAVARSDLHRVCRQEGVDAAQLWRAAPHPIA